MVIVENILDVEKYLENIDAVIFDLDDTLYSEKEYMDSGYRTIEKYLNVPGIAERMWYYNNQGQLAIDCALAEFNLIQEKEHALYIYRHHKPNIHLYRGVKEMLNRLNKKIGIITDGYPETQHKKIESLGLKVDYIIATDELGGIQFRKPNKIAFEIMQKKMNIPYEKMIYVGDNIKKDLIGPEKLGMKTIWFKNKDGIYYLEQ